jgi:hypothetical protein
MPVTLRYGVTLTVEAALSSATGSYGAWDSGLWNTATWGPDETWQDITAYVQSISTTRKFDRDIATWVAGSATLKLKNQDGRFSSANLSGPYVSAGVTGIRPWRPIRIRAAYAGTTYDVYRGYALKWQESYAQGPGSTGGAAFVTVPCTDEMGALARFNGIGQSPVGASEASGQRIHRVLNAAGHTGVRDIDLGVTTLQATTLGANAVTEMQLDTDSEGGALYIDRAGAVVFERMTALVENSRSNTVQAIFGDGAGELPYADPILTDDGDLMVNIAAFQRVGGTVQTATDATSRALNRDKQKSRTDLVCETDAQVANLASFYVQQFADPEERIGSVVINPLRSPAALWPQVLGREVRDLVLVNRRPPGGFTISQLSHLAGISHTIVPSTSTWQTTFDLWSASVFLGVGRWDVATWDTSTWFF